MGTRILTIVHKNAESEEKIICSSNDCFLLPQMEYVGTITYNGKFKTRGECYSGDPDYFYRSAIVAWKPFEWS